MVVYDFKDLVDQFKSQISEAILRFNNDYPTNDLLVTQVIYKNGDTAAREMREDSVFSKMIDDLNNRLVTSDSFDIRFSFLDPNSNKSHLTSLTVPTIYLIDKNYNLCDELKELIDWTIQELAS